MAGSSLRIIANPDCSPRTLNSGLPVYAAGAGMKSYGANIAWVHSFTPSWFSMLGVRVHRLAGDAVDSPVVEEKTATGVTAFVGYRF